MSYSGNRVDTSDHLGAALAADPEFALAHCLKGYLMMLTYNAAVRAEGDGIGAVAAPA